MLWCRRIEPGHARGTVARPNDRHCTGSGGAQCSHSYGQRKALQDVSLTVPSSRFTALLGLNGAGKTTLFSLITRLYDTRQGAIEVLGHRVSREPGKALRLLGVVFQARTLDLDISVMDNLLYHAALHGRATRGQSACDRRIAGN